MRFTKEEAGVKKALPCGPERYVQTFEAFFPRTKGTLWVF